MLSTKQHMAMLYYGYAPFYDGYMKLYFFFNIKSNFCVLHEFIINLAEKMQPSLVETKATFLRGCLPFF